jgi:hypothetical protein
MSLLTLFLVTQTIYAIIATLFFVVFISLLVLLIRDIYVLNKKVDKIAERTMETADEAKDFVEKIGKNVLGYLMIKVYKAANKEKK